MGYSCCGKLRKPKIWLKASIGDLVGIAFLGSFFGGIYIFIGWALSAGLWASIEAGEFGNRTWYGARNGTGFLIVLFLLVKGMPVFLRVLSLFVDYKLRVESKCNICGDEKLLIDLPTKADPF